MRVSDVHTHLGVQVLVRCTEHIEHIEPHVIDSGVVVAADGVTKGQEWQAGVEEIAHQNVCTCVG